MVEASFCGQHGSVPNRKISPHAHVDRRLLQDYDIKQFFVESFQAFHGCPRFVHNTWTVENFREILRNPDIHSAIIIISLRSFLL
jgi:hypothetical protein